MLNPKKLIVSHAPFWHIGNSVTQRNYTTLLAMLPAVVFGIMQYGMPAIAVVSFSMATAMLWELLLNRAMGRPITIGDGNAALIGLVFAMLLPATAPWWLVLTGTFVAIVLGQQIFGGIGANPVHPVALALAILMVSWKDFFDFNFMLRHYDLGFAMTYPLASLKAFGPQVVAGFSPWDLLLGRQIGGIGATFGLGIIAGGFFLLFKGVTRWEISLSFVAGIFFTALIFHLSNPVRFATPLFHLFSGYTLMAAFFLATENASSPVNVIPMLLYGAIGGMMTVLIRNIGAYQDGAIFAILLINLINPLLDKIRPKAIGKVA
ncbi:MAG: RnfABCDGE type electron transport complex subunit D [Desulfobacterales bacterium]|nr:RnfABCDGE type electron transport complex subunit D [Desulfobacterales bacterium]